jgi:hypothetical protein
MNGGYGDGGGANVDDEGGGFAGGEAGLVRAVLGLLGAELALTRQGHRFGQASMQDSPSSP